MPLDIMIIIFVILPFLVAIAIFMSSKPQVKPLEYSNLKNNINKPKKEPIYNDDKKSSMRRPSDHPHTLDVKQMYEIFGFNRFNEIINNTNLPLIDDVCIDRMKHWYREILEKVVNYNVHSQREDIDRIQDSIRYTLLACYKEIGEYKYDTSIVNRAIDLVETPYDAAIWGVYQSIHNKNIIMYIIYLQTLHYKLKIEQPLETEDIIIAYSILEIIRVK